MFPVFPHPPVGDGLLQVVEDKPALLDTSDDRGKVVVQQDHISGLLGDIATSDTHSNTDISLFQSGRVVDTITGDSHNLASPLAALNDDQLLLGRSPGEDDFFVVADDVVNVFGRHVFDFGTVDDGGLGVAGVDLFDGDSGPLGDLLDGLVF